MTPLTHDEDMALRAYRSAAQFGGPDDVCHTLNSELRAGKAVSELSPKFQSHIATMDGLKAKLPKTTGELKLYRGFCSDSLLSLTKDWTWSEPSYWSTSRQEGAAKGFLTGPGCAHLLHLFIPAESVVFDFAQLFPAGNGEDEVLILRNSEWDVVDYAIKAPINIVPKHRSHHFSCADLTALRLKRISMV